MIRKFETAIKKTPFKGLEDIFLFLKMLMFLEALRVEEDDSHLEKKSVFVDPCHSKVRVHSQDHQKVHGRLAGNPRRGLTQVV